MNSKESILDSVKLALGIITEYSHFDDQLIMDINSVFSTLWQLGVGPDDGFQIQDDLEVWSEFIDNNKLLNLCKTFMFMSVKLMFDPPSNSFALTSMKEQIKEQEWRINVMVDPDVPSRLNQSLLIRLNWTMRNSLTSLRSKAMNLLVIRSIAN